MTHVGFSSDMKGGATLAAEASSHNDDFVTIKSRLRPNELFIISVRDNDEMLSVLGVFFVHFMKSSWLWL